MLHRIFTVIALISIPLAVYSQEVSGQQISDQQAPEFSHQNPISHQLANQAQPGGKKFTANEFIVVTAHPEASKTAYKILNAGGNAIDALVASQLVLGLVEPQSSGLGGGAFLVYYNAKTKKITTFDGRETAPLSVSPDLFLKPNGQALNFFDAVIGGRSVGVPGLPRLLGDVHVQHGSMRWARLVDDAIKLAENGFVVTPRLANSVSRDANNLKSDPTTWNYFAPENRVISVGDTLKNPQYATTLKLLAEGGSDAFYKAPFSSAIIDKVKRAKNPGHLSQKDFDRYNVIERAALCFDYKQFEVCGMGPPSSGETTIAQTLGIIENINFSRNDINPSVRWQIISDAYRLAFADRGAYIADPDFVKFDLKLLDKSYLRRRANLITLGTALANVQPGRPSSKVAQYKYAQSIEQPSTTHLVIVDRQGNIASMTSTIENGFGSRLMVSGFLLNNELTDFSFTPTKDSKLVANRVEPGKRPRSSMAPTIVLKNKQPVLAIGSPGGSRIINYVGNTIIKVLDLDNNLFDAINSPHIVNRFGKLELETGHFSDNDVAQFEQLGYQVVQKDLNSGIHAVHFKDGQLHGAADLRREGLVLGK